MTWKPIVAGVDMSPEGIRAAVFAAKLAERAHTECYLVHAVRDPWTDTPLAPIPGDLAQINRVILESAALELRRLLQDKVPPDVLESLDVQFGPPGPVLNGVIDRRRPGLLVLGGKPHSTVGRWLGGSTAHYLARASVVPVLVTGSAHGAIRRVLAAVDLSSAARHTLAAAERLANLFGARLGAVHVVEPVPYVPGLPVTLTDNEVARLAEAELHAHVWPLVTRPDFEHLIRRGPTAGGIAAAATEWAADLLVVGSHGKGWVDRMRLGSVTERLLNHAPTAMLVVPVRQTISRRPARHSGSARRVAAAAGR